jgi:hypothetical protein
LIFQIEFGKYNLLSDDERIIHGGGVLDHSAAWDVSELRGNISVGKEASMVAFDCHNYRDLYLGPELLA